MIESGKDPASVANMPFSFIMAVLREDMEEDEGVKQVNSFFDL